MIEFGSCEEAPRTAKHTHPAKFLLRSTIHLWTGALTLLGDWPAKIVTPACSFCDVITPNQRHLTSTNIRLLDNVNAKGFTLAIDRFVDTPMTPAITELCARFANITQAFPIDSDGNGRPAFDILARRNQWAFGAVG